MALVPTLPPQKPLVVVSTSNVGGALNPISLTLKAGGLPGITRLDQLADVVESSPADGMTLVYQSSTDKYVVQTMNIDGGEF